MGRRQMIRDATAALDSSQHSRRMLYIFTYVSTLLGLQILHLALDDLPMLIALTAGVTGGFVYSYYLAQRHRPMTTYGVSLVALLLSVYYFVQMLRSHEMMANYLGILLGVLTVLLAFKAFAPSDHRFILLVCVVFLLYSSAASYDIKFLMLLPVFLIFAGFVLYISNQFEISMRVGGSETPSVSLALGKGFFGILMRAVGGIIALSIIAYIVTPHSSSGSHSLALRPATSVQAPSDSNMTPEEQEEERRQRQQQQGQDSVAQVGLGDEFDLSQPSELDADPRPVLKVRGRRNGYLRAKVYQVYAGSGWMEFPHPRPPLKHIPPPAAEQGAGPQPLLEVEEAIRNPGRFRPAETVNVTSLTGGFDRYTVPVFDFPDPLFLESRKDWKIQLAPDNINSRNTEKLNYDIIIQEVTFLEEGPGIFLSMYQPFRIENVSRLPGGGLENVPRYNRDSIVSARPGQSHPLNFSYVVHSLEPSVSPGALQHIFTKGPEPIVALYTQVPLSQNPTNDELAHLGISREQYRPISSRMLNHATKFSRSADGSEALPWETVNNIYEYLTDPSAFTYARQYEPLDPALEITEAFCLGTREGYCRYFASSMAVMCRINGIPARVVTGYKPGSFSLVENANVYKASDAHAWVEVYFDGYGWLTFDPSPASQDITQQEALQVLGSISDFLQELFVIDPASTQQMLLESLKEFWGFLLRNRLYTAGLVGLIALLAGLWWLRGKLSIRPRVETFRPENAVVAGFYGAQQELRRLGLRRHKGSTGRQFAQEAALAFPELSEDIQGFVPLYERAAYSPASLSSEDAGTATELSGRIAQFVRDELKRRKQSR